MKNTGERHIIENTFSSMAELYIHLLHIASYDYSKKIVANKKVMDYGCGSGYGAHILSQSAEFVIGTDIDQETIEFAKNHYTANNLIFKNMFELDKGTEKFDVITAFQVIEHVSDLNKFILKLKSNLKPGGMVLITTPDRSSRLFKIQNPWNIYHLTEYSEKSVYKKLRKHFVDVDIYKISAPKELVMSEITRRKKQRLITLPFSLAIYPNVLRVFLLRFEANLFTLLSSILKKQRNKDLLSLTDENNPFQNYSSDDIIIAKNVDIPTDFFIICRS